MRTRVNRFRWAWLGLRFAFWVLLYREETLLALQEGMRQAGWEPSE